MSWEGAIPKRQLKTNGLRNKRNRKGPKALQAKAARLAKMQEDKRRKLGEHRGGGHGMGQDDW